MYDIVFKPKMVIKIHALRDFVVEWTKTQSPPSE
jgi:hypothetical protein